MSFFQNQHLINEVNQIKLDISRARYVELDSRWKFHKNTMAPFTRIYFVTEGSADIMCNNKPYKLLPNNIYIIPAGTPFCYDCPERLCKLYFQINLFSSNGEDIFLGAPGCITLLDRKSFVAQMVALFRRSDYQSALTIRQYLEQICCEVLACTDAQQKIPNYTPPIKKALSIIAASPHLSMTVSVLANKVFLSPSIFQKRFKKEVGSTPMHYLKRRIITAAEDDLCGTNMSLSEIADKYGFCDQFHFSRTFARYCGASPSNYRKIHTI